MVLNEPGRAVGVVTLESVLDEVFGKITAPSREMESVQPVLALDKTYRGDTRISDFNKQLGVSLHDEGVMTLADLVEKHLGHHPEKGESVFIEPFRFEVLEATLLDVRRIRVRTRTR